MEAGYPGGDCEPWEREFAVLLWNLCQFYRTDLRQTALTEFADVDTRALLMCDVMHFLTGRQTPSLPAQVVASMALRTVLDTSKPGPLIDRETFDERWSEVLDEAEAHFLAMMPKGAH